MSRSMATTTRRERRAAERANRPRRQRPVRTTRRTFGLQTLSILGLVGGVAAIALAIAFGARPAASPSQDAVAVAFAPAGIATDGLVLGSPDAPVTIDLFEDFQCPACALWSRTVFPGLVSNELAAGTVELVEIAYTSHPEQEVTFE